jgi:protein-L-isoaspartate(D-aspartate) O-methyltransferase
MSEDDIHAARRWYAEELKFIARVQSHLVTDAFANVPREHFSGPGPWRVLSPGRSLEYWTTESADPLHLYHNVLVAIDETRGLNNGQPSLWAALFDELGLARGNAIIHIGTGTGYYTAILAQIVGAAGQVTGVEIDDGLAVRSRENLALAWPQATVVAANGFTFVPSKPVDAIIVAAGVSHLSHTWLEGLAENGRLLVPLTVGIRGAFLLITRHGDSTGRFTTRMVSWTGIIPCVGGKDAEAEARLKNALQSANYGAIRSLRRPPEMPDDTCWLAGDGWWLSTADLPATESDKV